MSIQLTQQAIDAAIPQLAGVLEKYAWLQARATASDDFHIEPEFRRRFNHLYQVRRALPWREAFYSLMAKAHREQLRFRSVLDLLHAATGRFEASFASKLVATLNPAAPVIDARVTQAVGLVLPPATAPDRSAQIEKVHAELSRYFAEFLPTSTGRYLIKRFDAHYPKLAKRVSAEKKVDFVLWKADAMCDAERVRKLA